MSYATDVSGMNIDELRRYNEAIQVCSSRCYDIVVANLVIDPHDRPGRSAGTPGLLTSTTVYIGASLHPFFLGATQCATVVYSQCSSFGFRWLLRRLVEPLPTFERNTAVGHQPLHCTW